MTTTFVLAAPRIVVGLLMAGHGLQKLAGWFGGPGLQGTADFLGSLHVRAGSRWAMALAVAETIGGALMALGFLQPLGQLVVATVLLVAIALVHWQKGLWNTNGGLEHPLVLATVALASATAPIGWSLDGTLGIAVPAWISLIAAIAMAIVALGVVVGRSTAAGVPVPAETAPASNGETEGSRPMPPVRWAIWRRDLRIWR
ncbi:MAG TPA: DoxX family protein [Candidatus Limnocylindrales bacterium]|nr:DoxX family protein [Candidatus Limnocylindrales bacterium]